ncbi:MAG: hypothetical protein ACLUUO_01460 [Sellimonas intestinalis]
MLPVGIVWSITKKMGTTQILGIILRFNPGIFPAIKWVQCGGPHRRPIFRYGISEFTKVEMIGYQGQVIAAMMAGFVAWYTWRNSSRNTARK